MNKQKELKALNDKLLMLNRRAEADRAEDEEKLREARRKLEAAKIAIETADDPDEFRLAKQSIEDAREDIDFYERQKHKHKRLINEGEYIEAAAFIDTELEALIANTRKDIKADFEAIMEKIEAYNKAVHSLTTTKSLLNAVAAKPYISPGNYNAHLMILPGEYNSFDHFSNFMSFCDKEAERDGKAFLLNIM